LLVVAVAVELAAVVVVAALVDIEPQQAFQSQPDHPSQ
jgi:hypothetical protein